MKIQCDVCEARSRVVCCADEAALCSGCDLKVHIGNKLATKHQRLPLYPSAMPKCDVCRKHRDVMMHIWLLCDRFFRKKIQEALGWFFCLEDRAVLCRKCDVATHKGSSRQFNHRRLLLTGIRVGLGAKVTPPHMVDVSEAQGSEQLVSEWSRILKSADEEALNNNLGEATDDISWTVPMSLSTHPEPDIHAITISTDATAMSVAQAATVAAQSHLQKAETTKRIRTTNLEVQESHILESTLTFS
ncbi:B-box zinc finger protein 22 [Sesamum angolense]|uniref:B-box zinc finger protein 22 n=1 Tax=Sesamum angolense TaxID=2727404 RepID=A0AAE1WRG2_9LAMI|nr:B-box zinc finger protein 22 [Sesamum angolense]